MKALKFAMFSQGDVHLIIAEAFLWQKYSGCCDVSDILMHFAFIFNVVNFDQDLNSASE